MALTFLQVQKARPGRHADEKGLYLLVKPSGAKSWVLRVQVGGKRRDYGLGSLDLVSLSEAREKAREWRKLAKLGSNPSSESKKARRSVPTFMEAAIACHQNSEAGWQNGKHVAQWLSTLRTYAFPVIGDQRVDQIEAPDIHKVLIPIWQSKPETARRVRQRIATVLDHSRAQGWRETDPPMRAVNVLLKALKQPKGRHFEAMPYADLPSFMKGLREAEKTIGRRALEFTILTAARSGETRHATFEEIDWEAKVWDVPAERMKMRRPHSVPLSERALAILSEMKADGPGTGLIFPGLKRKPLSDMTLAKVLKTAGADAFTVHGFRSTFRDWVAEQTRFPSEWAEAALAHAQTNKVEAAYRRTTFVEQRRGLMADWAAYLTGPSYRDS